MLSNKGKDITNPKQCNNIMIGSKVLVMYNEGFLMDGFCPVMVASYGIYTSNNEVDHTVLGVYQQVV